ncbi:hypothetical protein BXU09_14785 [Deinococcus sp. LM3]|nr:hypothetical protein BXU09_14785 [Deinococcus sp. LM3]
MVNGEDGKKYIIGLYPQAASKIDKIHYSCDNFKTHINKEDWDPKSPKFIYIGSLSERKGIYNFLEHLYRYSMQSDRSFVISIIGEEADFKHADLKKFATEKIKISFYGFRQSLEIEEILSHQDVCVVPSIADSWSLVVNESLSLGVPVLGSNRSQAVSELINQNNGWIFDPYSYESLERCLNNIVNISDREMGQLKTNCQLSVKMIDNSEIYKSYLSMFKRTVK